MAIVKGDNAIFYVYENGGWRMYACARTGSLNITTETVETSTTGSGNWATFEPQKNGWTATWDGVTNLDVPGMLTLPDLQQKQISFTKLLINFERTDVDGNVYANQGTAIITNRSDSGGINEVDTFTIELLGTGELTQIFTPTNLLLSAVKIYPTIDDPFAFTGGETSITVPTLINKDILDFSLDGISFYTIITSGTPVSKQVKYTSSTGTFEWMIPAEPGQTLKIQYQDI